MSENSKTVWAAGGVVWRVTGKGKVEVCIVHRRKYDDWSLPKGKAERKEILAATAAREVFEETGFTVRLGRQLHTIGYPLRSGTPKRVAYWSMHATGGKFVPNKETDDVQWLSVDGARQTVSYDADRAVLADFAVLPDHQLHSFVLVRHGKAGRRGMFGVDDTRRPLDETGQAQAQALSGVLELFGVSELHAADRLRCVQTLEPTAQRLGVDVVVEPTQTEEATSADPDAALTRLRQLAAPFDGVRALCGQGGSIAPLLERWSSQDGVDCPVSRFRKGSVSVLTLLGDELVQIDHLTTPLPQKRPTPSR
ncbi:MAG: NUDIX hydrolase [Gordonia sp. (in: high G+C Gram-positive bacteria)]|uniref:NUDIX hydrolase n=1 Tax=Gordonia sp. (in: high G+C Gram-positive bacteria) TaxID=84139 RepID=UPI0039E441E3